eukprot:12424-Heterococcus_DN1.PRE.2
MQKLDLELACTEPDFRSRCTQRMRMHDAAQEERTYGIQHALHAHTHAAVSKEWQLLMPHEDHTPQKPSEPVMKPSLAAAAISAFCESHCHTCYTDY